MTSSIPHKILTASTLCLLLQPLAANSVWAQATNSQPAANSAASQPSQLSNQQLFNQQLPNQPLSNQSAQGATQTGRHAEASISLESPGIPGGYRLGSGDEIQVTVFGYEE
ncbi:MAG: hypothetical protein ACKO7W_06550 [Elainella sp.]